MDEPIIGSDHAYKHGFIKCEQVKLIRLIRRMMLAGIEKL